jgi:hypothetical protein
MPGQAAYEVIMGAGRLYLGDFSLTGANEPALAAINVSPQASAWTDTGFTSDGVTLTFNQTFVKMNVDQVADAVGAKMTERALQVVTNFAQATLENLLYALNTGAITTGSGYKYLDPEYDGDELQPTYRALLFDGYAPASSAGVVKRRRVLVRKVLNTESVGVPYKKGDLTLVPVTFDSFYVSNSLAPFRVIDET